MRLNRYVLLSLLLTTFYPIQSFAASNYIWWEGETPTETNFPQSVWYNAGALDGKHDLLSGGTWLANDGNRTGDAAFAKYTVAIPEAGDYDFWTRKFWKHGPFQWRFNEGEWRVCSGDVALADSVSIQQFLSANWVSLGTVSLPKGDVVFELRLLAEPGESETACFDCFLLTQYPFIPRGKLKPDEKSGLADPGFFAWEPEMDAFSDEALLDLRSLNEPIAGQSGFVQRQGEQFVLGDGTPVRFWAVNLSSEIAALNRRSIDSMARRLAKAGVNMVRYHSPLFQSNDPEQVNPQKLDNLFYLIDALKKNGIYTTVSFYFPLWFSIQSNYGIPGYDAIDNKRPFALLYFDERMQQIYKSWAKALLTTPSPYSNHTLADEPAVAIVEIVNEDSYFFWTFTKSNVPPLQWQKLETLYGQWLIERYGSLNQALAAWGGAGESGDDIAAGRMTLFEAWNMTGSSVRQANAARLKRIGDQVRFLTESQHGFYASIKTYFTKELGSKSFVSPSNWQVTDPNMLDALERYTYTAGDVIDRHGYFSGEHTSSNGSHAYSVAEGHTFKNLSALTVPENLPLQFAQIDDFPHIISEIGWTNPNLYRADYCFLASAYGSLQGVDAFYTFALGGAFWDTNMNKFALSCPVILGNFPAYALLYRRGDLQTAQPVVHQILDVEDLYAMKGSGASAAQALDDLRLADVPPGESASGEVQNIDPYSFYVGRVQRTFAKNTEDSQETNLAAFIDRNQKTIASQTGELVWKYGQGVATMNAPQSQGATGFLKQAGKIELGDIFIESQNTYASIILTSLDNQPLSDSNKILIQVMTEERPYGFRVSDGEQGTITNMGGYPFGVRKIQGTISVKLNQGDSVNLIPLDENGYAAQSPMELKRTGVDQPFVIQLPENAVYSILQRPSSTNVNNWPLRDK